MLFSSLPLTPPWPRALPEKLGRLGRREGVIVLVLALLAIATRFYQLGAESLWLDEAITYHRARVPFGELVADAKTNHHDPAYFLLVKAWMVFGDSEFVLRAPSACAGVLNVLAVYALGRVVGGRWVGLGAALVILLNLASVKYDQEARMYASYALGATIAIAGLMWLLDHPEKAGLRLWRLARDAEERQVPLAGVRLAWLAFWFGAVVTLYSHATAALFIVACSLVALVFIAVRPRQRRDFFVNWVIANLAVLLGFSLWLTQFTEQTAVVAGGGFWMKYPTLRDVQVALRLILLSYPVPWVWALILALTLRGSFALRKKPLLLAALWMFSVLGPGLLLLVSLRQPVFMHRQFLWAAAPFAVLVGAGLVAPVREWRRSVALVAYLVLGTMLLQKFYYEPMRKARWRDAIALVKRNLQPGDVVLTIGNREVRMLEYYFGRRSRPLARFVYTDFPGDWEGTYDKLIADAPAVWTIRSGPSPSAKEARQVLTSRGRRDVTRSFGKRLVVERYALKPDVKRISDPSEDAPKKKTKEKAKANAKKAKANAKKAKANAKKAKAKKTKEKKSKTSGKKAPRKRKVAAPPPSASALH